MNLDRILSALVHVNMIKENGQVTYINQFCKPNGEEITSKESTSSKVELTQEV